MYGSSSTKVNAEQIMRLYGAAAYPGCDEGMIATDGDLTRERSKSPTKLGVIVRHVSALSPADAQDAASSSAAGFGAIWRDHIEPLVGTELARETGKTMRILEVDGSGVRRVTTGGTTQRIGIDTFRWTIKRLLDGETVSRKEIHEHDPRQVSSGIMLILGVIPNVECVTHQGAKAIRMRSSAAAGAS